MTAAPKNERLCHAFFSVLASYTMRLVLKHKLIDKEKKALCHAFIYTHGNIITAVNFYIYSLTRERDILVCNYGVFKTCVSSQVVFRQALT